MLAAHFSKGESGSWPARSAIDCWCSGAEEGELGEAMSAVGTPSDAALVRRLRGGQADAASTLYLRYALRIRRLAEQQLGSGLGRRLDPEDIVQSVFRTFFRRTRCGQYDVPEGEELWKLLLIISLNKIRATARHHRSAKRDVGCTSSLGDRDIAVSPVVGFSFHSSA